MKIQLGIAKLLRISWYTPVLYRGAQQPLFNNKDLIYVPFCPLEHKKRANVLKDKIIFMSVGKYEQRKNHMQLLNAFIRLSKDFSNVYLKIIGATGSNERESFFASLQDYIKLNNIDNNVELKKNLSYSEMQQEYLNSSVFVFPARKEPASISQIEALSYGLPVICSTDNGTAHYVINNVSGFLIEPTEESIYSAMKKYVEDRDLLFDHSQNAYNDIQENYSYDKIFNVISNLIS